MIKRETTLKKAFDSYLKDFNSDEQSLQAGDRDPWMRIELGEGLAPLPYMVFICLVIFKGFAYWGKGEKVLWEIPIRYKSYPFLLSHRKFGFRIDYKGQEPPKYIVTQMVRQLHKASGVADKLMQPFARQQFQSGNVTVANRYLSLDMRYHFFRKKAKQAFARPERKRKANAKHKEPVVTEISEAINYQIRAEREGAYYGIAMFDAYFSKLEHLLILVLPFLGFDCTKENLIELMSSQWSDKYKRIFNLAQDRKAKRLYERLSEIKEKYRNTITHGDFEKGGASLYFHIPRLGAVPAHLSRFRDSIHYSFFPLAMDSYMQICDSLDEVDDFLRTGKTKYGVMFAESGLDVSFSRKSLVKYKVAAQSHAKFISFIEREAYYDSIFTNMDF